MQQKVRLATGKRIPGTRYRIVRWLGAGGMGEVFEAMHVDIRRRVALKVLKPGCDEERRASFMLEARTIAQIESRFVVDVLDSGELPDGRPFYAMELLADCSLYTVICQGRIPLVRALPILRQCCKALAAVHEAGIVHRDLKPENLLLQTNEGRRDMVRLVDFGISAPIGASAASIAGTPMYMAPEQILGLKFDPRVDIYALGCVAYEMLSGAPPFSGGSMALFSQHLDAQPDSLTGRWPELPEQLDELLGRCLAKQPEDRWPNALELEAALCELQIAVGFTTRWDDLAIPEIGAERRDQLAARMPRPRSGRGRKRLLAAGGALAFSLVALTISLWPKANQQVDGSGIVDATWVDLYADEARAAAARARWVYPPRDQPKAKTARNWVEAIETRAGLTDYRAWSRAQVLRAEFAATLVGLGDQYWEKHNGRPFAVEFYANALMFEPDNPHAKMRVSLTPAQLADVGARAARGEFSDAELAAGEMLLALAEGDEQARRKRVARLLDDKRAPRASQTVEALVSLIRGHAREAPRTKELEAEVVEAAAAAAKPDDALYDTAVATERAQELAQAGLDDLNKGKRDRAERLFHKTVDLDSRNEIAVLGLAQVYFDRGDYGRSLTYARKAVGLLPRDADVRLLLGDVYLKTLRYADARAAYGRAAKLGHVLARARLDRLDQMTK